MIAKNKILPAAEYVRMSTDLQCYSIKNQQEKIREYAELNNLSIVQTYADSGKSGLHLKRRDALQQLLADVTSGVGSFDVILVYDVSRWGRFQDTDEAAHYEFVCRRAGKAVIYCAEPFTNDGTPMASIVKGLKRVMAGEYSRELSSKVKAGQQRIAQMGFHVGARATFGLRRLIIDKEGKPRKLMEFGERKAIQTDRVVLVPGPKPEVDCVRKIFHWFVKDRWNYQQIADHLNELRIKPAAGMRYWTRYQVKLILTSEKYIGTMVYNKTSTKLSTARIYNPEGSWIRTPKAFTPIISQSEFDLAQARKHDNPRKYRETDLLSHLQKIRSTHGFLSGSLLRKLKSGPTPETYVKHFGSIAAALAAAGYDRQNDPRRAARRSHDTRLRLNSAVPWLMEMLEENGFSVVRTGLSSMLVNNKHRLTVNVPTLPDDHRGIRIWIDKRASVEVVVDMPAPELGGSCLVLKPAWSSRRSIQLSSAKQLDSVGQWRCEVDQVIGFVLRYLPSQVP